MRYQNVCVESFGYVVPDEVVTTPELEAALEPLYTRLRLPTGRLELMTGIRERRFWPRGTLPGSMSVVSGERALEKASFDPRDVGALVHGSVCRDYIEPATAVGVHHRLGLRADCQVFDVSNACLGILNGMLQVANLIELGQIRAGLVVGTEDSRPVVEHTIELLNDDQTLTRDTVKTAIATLTLGSASAAVLLTHSSVSRTQHRLLGGAVRSFSQHHTLCHSGHDEAMADGVRPQMQTDSEALLHAGVEGASQTFPAFLDAVGWSREQLTNTFCHQVGVAHRKLLYQSLELDPKLDFSTVEWLGNTGAAALPITVALGIEAGCVQPGARIGLLGIGSGINVVMLGLEWAA